MTCHLQVVAESSQSIVICALSTSFPLIGKALYQFLIFILYAKCFEYRTRTGFYFLYIQIFAFLGVTALKSGALFIFVGSTCHSVIKNSHQLYLLYISSHKVLSLFFVSLLFVGSFVAIGIALKSSFVYCLSVERAFWRLYRRFNSFLELIL